LTGQYPFRHRSICIPNDTEVPRAFQADGSLFPELLRGAGYRTGCVGKWHLGEDAATDRNPWPTECGFDDYAPESEYPRWREAQGLPPRDADLDPADLGALFAGGTDRAITPEQSQVFYTADRTISFLEEYAGTGRPFLLRWDPSEPHIPNRIPEPYASMYDPADLPRWPSFDDDFTCKPFIQRQQLRSWGMEDWSWERGWAQLTANAKPRGGILSASAGRRQNRGQSIKRP
jgi:arylsulfatase A-like enzyme